MPVLTGTSSHFVRGMISKEHEGWIAQLRENMRTHFVQGAVAWTCGGGDAAEAAGSVHSGVVEVGQRAA